jgi:hypothetical protein
MQCFYHLACHRAELRFEMLRMPAPVSQPDDVALHAAATELAARLHQALTAHAQQRGRSGRRYQLLSGAWQDAKSAARLLQPLLPELRRGPRPTLSTGLRSPGNQ